MCVFISRKWSHAISGNMVTRNKNKLAERKAFVDTVGIKSADLKDKSLFWSFVALQTA